MGSRNQLESDDGQTMRDLAIKSSLRQIADIQALGEEAEDHQPRGSAATLTAETIRVLSSELHQIHQEAVSIRDGSAQTVWQKSKRWAQVRLGRIRPK